MVEVNLKALVARLNRYCTRSLEAAAGLCVSRTNYEVTPEHLMHALIEDATADVQVIFKQFGVDPGRVQKSLSTLIESLKTGNAGRPTFSPLLVEWFQQAWLMASLDFGPAGRLALEDRDGQTVVRLLRAAPEGSDSWDGVYDDINEGWLTFVQQLRFMLERHPGEERETVHVPLTGEPFFQSENQVGVINDGQLIIRTSERVIASRYGG